MFLINPAATFMAGGVILGVYVWLERRELSAAWGDVRHGIWMAMLRTGLLRADQGDSDARNWRPPHPGARRRADETMATHPAGRRPGSQPHLDDRGRRVVAGLRRPGVVVSRWPLRSRTFSNGAACKALVRIVDAEDRHEGIRQFVESYGLGSVVPNTIVVGTSADPAGFERYASLIETLHSARRKRIDLLRGRRTRPRLSAAHRRLVGWLAPQRRPDDGARLPVCAAVCDGTPPTSG